jgi:hypothetical protein
MAESSASDSHLPGLTIDTVADLTNASYSDIEYGHVTLGRENQAGKEIIEGGRITARNQHFLTLRSGDSERDIDISKDWTLHRWNPIRSSIERDEILDEWDIDPDDNQPTENRSLF